jgi:hypothetical protein
VAEDSRLPTPDYRLSATAPDPDPVVPPAPSFQDIELPASIPAGLITGHAAESSMLDRSRSAVWPLGLALVVGIALGFAFGYGFGVREQSASTAPPPPGREFTERAVAEPTKVDDPKVQLPLDPAAKTEAVRLTPDTTASTTAAPAPTKPAQTRTTGPGRLVIRSTPAGALVAVDGHDSGKTPVTVRDLPAGAHRVRITHEGFAPVERRVTITRARPAQSMTIALDRLRAAPAASAAPATTGTLRFESRPAGATVYLDGKMIGTTPLSQAAMAGDHAVRLELSGYRDWTSSIRVAATETSRVTASLER